MLAGKSAAIHTVTSRAPLETHAALADSTGAF
jgi:hypothetical protein